MGIPFNDRGLNGPNPGALFSYVRPRKAHYYRPTEKVATRAKEG